MGESFFIKPLRAEDAPRIPCHVAREKQDSSAGGRRDSYSLGLTKQRYVGT
jgi:hypothetical protein